DGGRRARRTDREAARTARHGRAPAPRRAARQGHPPLAGARGVRALGRRRSPVELGDLAAGDRDVARPSLAAVPERVHPVLDSVEDGDVQRTAVDAPLEHVLAAPAGVVAGGADLDLLVEQPRIRVDEEGAELPAELEHDGLGAGPVVEVVMMLLAHGALLRSEEHTSEL